MMNSYRRGRSAAYEIFREAWQLVFLFSLVISGCSGLISAKNAPPSLTVSITSPASGTTVSGSITVSASASSSSGIASVQFQVDGANLGAANTAAPYSQTLNATTLAKGNHRLTAIATSSAGIKATSATVLITVNNNQGNPPTVSITSPSAGAKVSGTITVSASASDSSGIANVQFLLDGSNLGAPITTAPYAISWNSTTVVDGAHTVAAIATSSAGLKATSATVLVTVNNIQGNPPTVSITSPSAGAKVSGTITVSASASDSSGIANVQFLLDGSNLGAPITTAPYAMSWNSTTAADGPHTVAAIATATNTSQASAMVSLTVNNNTTTPGPTLNSAPGWHVIQGTRIRPDGAENVSPCPPDGFRGYRPIQAAGGYATSCYNIIADPSDATIDWPRYRMLLWGGGHNDYAGNEVYSLELGLIGNTPPIGPNSNGPLVRLTPPAPPNQSLFGTNETLVPAMQGPGRYLIPSRPTPNARHLYDGGEFIHSKDQLIQFGGALNSSGGASHSAWTLNLSSINSSCAPDCDPAWTDTGLTVPGAIVGTMAKIDPNTGYIWLGQVTGLWMLDSANISGGFTQVGNVSMGYHATSVMDPEDGYFIDIHSFGDSPNTIGYWNIKNWRPGSGNLTHQIAPIDPVCATMFATATLDKWSYPGLQWDPIGHRVAIYPGGGNTIYYLFPKTWTCKSETYGSTQGVDYPQDTFTQLGVESAMGTFTRFGYFPNLDVYVLCNDPNNNCWYLRPRR